MNRFITLISFFIISHQAVAQTSEIDILVSCAPSKHTDFIFGPSDFLYFLNADGALGEGGAKLISKATLPMGVTLQGSTTAYQNKNPQIFKLKLDRLQAYLDLRNSNDNPFPELKTPKNLGDVLQEFQEMTSSGCDFITPTRFYTMLKPKIEKEEPSSTKLKEDLASCLAKVEVCTQSSGVIDSLNRDTKSTTDKIKERSSQNSKASKQ